MCKIIFFAFWFHSGNSVSYLSSHTETVTIVDRVRETAAAQKAKECMFIVDMLHGNKNNGILTKGFEPLIDNSVNERILFGTQHKQYI